MADLTQLLSDAADPVGAGPDLVAITERAGALRRRASGAAVVVAAVVPFLVLDGGDGTEELRQADTPAGPETTATITATPSAPQIAPSPPTVRRSPGQGGVVPVPGGSPRLETRRAEPAPSGARPTGSERAAVPSPDPSPGGEEFPPAASCTLTTRDLQTDTERTCRFTATRNGGWQLTRGVGVFAGYDPGTYRVHVVRDGREVYDTDDIDTYDTEGNCDSEVIRPGDLVTLVLESNPNNYADVELAAGDGYGC